MIKGLRWKFILVNMTIVTMMLLVIFGMVLHSTASDMEEQSLRTLHFLLEDGFVNAGPPGDRYRSMQLPFFYMAVSVNSTGKILSSHGAYLELPDTETLEYIVETALRCEEELALLRDYNLRFCRKATPFGYKIVFVDVSGELATMDALVRSSVIIGLLAFAVFLALSFFLARWAVRPVEQAWKQQRQFVADASHELKTPLTVIMTNAELLTNQECGQEQKEQFVENIVTMSHQMRGLVEGLLELARVDNGSAKMAFAHLDFSELVSEAILPFDPVFFEQGLLLECDIEEDIQAWVSPSHIKQVLDILLDNAVKYSAPNGTVQLTLKRRGNHCLLSVSSPGDPIGKEDLQNIFRRFYRLDKARTMDHSYGLGLSIAESIVKEHGGKIWAESEAGQNTFYIQLSAADS